MPSDDVQQPGGREVTGYRAPRYPVFVVTGALLGLLVGLVLASTGSAPSETGPAGVLGFFAAFGTLLGALAGGTGALVVEWLLNRGRRGRARRPRGGTRRA